MMSTGTFENGANMNDRSSTAPRRCHIAIVGAGCSGLACAHHLLAHYINHQRDTIQEPEVEPKKAPLIILEDRNRVGGRIQSIHKSITVEDYTINIIVEKGAAWIHGIGHHPQWNPMTSLILDQCKTHKELISRFDPNQEINVLKEKKCFKISKLDRGYVKMSGKMVF